MPEEPDPEAQTDPDRTPEPDLPSDDRAARRRWKRGAFPVPPGRIESAPVFRPPADQEADSMAAPPADSPPAGDNASRRREPDTPDSAATADQS